MILQLKDALRKAWHNPRHLWYVWQNVNIVRDHFPALNRMRARIRKRFLSLELGSASRISKLHVILRTTDAVMHLSGSRNLEEIGIKDRNDVIRIGGRSLFPAAVHFLKKFGRDNLRITLVTDRLSDVGMSQYRDAAAVANVAFDVVIAAGHGNGPTFQTQIDIALKDDDDTLALILEDDYLLYEEALTIPFEVMRNHYKVIGFNPHFHPDRVRFQDIGKLAAVDGRLYCRVPSTCCTFFMPVRQMRKFEKYLRLYDGWEKGSVGVAWERGICLAPLGWTMAEHLHKSDLSPVQTLLRQEV